MFKPYAGRGVDQVRADLKREASVLDLMLDDSKRLHRRLGKEDQGKVDEYLDSIRALENGSNGPVSGRTSPCRPSIPRD